MVLKGSLTMSEAKVDMPETLYYALRVCRPGGKDYLGYYCVDSVKEFLQNFLTDVMHLMSLGIKIQFDFGDGTVINSDCTEVTLAH